MLIEQNGSSKGSNKSDRRSVLMKFNVQERNPRFMVNRGTSIYNNELENFLKPDENGTLLNVDDEHSYESQANVSFVNYSNLLGTSQEMQNKGFPIKVQKLINGGDRISKLMNKQHMEIEYPDRELDPSHMTPRRFFV